MSANAIVRARVDEHIKEDATAVLAAMGVAMAVASACSQSPGDCS